METVLKETYEFARVDKLFARLYTDRSRCLWRRFATDELTQYRVDSIADDVAAILIKHGVYSADEARTDRLMVEEASGAMPFRRVDDRIQAALRMLLEPYVGQALWKNAELISWRIAASAKYLMRGQVPYPTFIPLVTSPTPMVITDVHYGRTTAQGKQMLQVAFRFYGGSFAGLEFRQAIPYKYVLYKLAKEIGYPRFEGIHKNEIVGARLVGTVDTNDTQRPQLVDFFAPTGAKAANRKLYNKRLAHPRAGQPCKPKGFTWPCHQCPLGYRLVELDAPTLDNTCALATHSRTLIKKDCPRCHADYAMFDPADESPICVSCKAKEARSVLQAGG